MLVNNTAFVLTLAYPDTIVMVSKEWFSPFLRFFGVGKKNYVRAGHAALVLINKTTGVLEYHDFGRYITPEPFGRVRGSDTDAELQFPLKAQINDGVITNLYAILHFMSTHPKLTHGEGKLVASVCSAIDYEQARKHIVTMQNKHFIRYAAFGKLTCNCARFVTDTLIASVTDINIKKKLLKSNWFTPSTVGNVVLSSTEKQIYEVSETGIVSEFKGSQMSENRRCFLDRLKEYKPTFEGTLLPKRVQNLHDRAQWLSGIAAGAWFELHHIGHEAEYLFKRISPHGNIDIEDTFVVQDAGFNYHLHYEFVQYSNCNFFYIQQNGNVYRFNRKRES